MKRSRPLRSFSLFHRMVALTLTMTIPLVTMPDLALALPHGGGVAKGQATLGYSTGKLLVTQSTSSATFNWSSFNVKSGQSVVYRTPGSSSVSLNYIGGTTPSAINGAVTSNGIIEFMNPNGLIFGSGSVVSAAGVMAFGSATPWGKPTGAVTNAGTLTATTGGTVALVGSSVTNSGTISAPGGEVILAAGSTVTPVETTGTTSVSVTTTGGGSVDDSGVLAVETVGGRTGTILLQSGMGSGTTTLESTAVLDASAPNGGNGGKIILNGNTVSLEELAPINVTAPTGTKGTLTIDPSTTDLTTASALEAVDTAQVLTGCVSLGANINLSGASWTPLGNGTSSSNYFTGTFNGNGHVVSEYTITATNSNGTGFIGYLGSEGVVKNLGVAGTVNGGTYNNIGGIVGLNFSGGTVEYSYNTGRVSGSYYLGGIVGYNYGTVKTSYNAGNILGSAYAVGGVVGYNSGTVEYSYNTESIRSSSYYVGGVVGENDGTVEYSYNTGSVQGSTCVGGVIGVDFETNAKVEYSYNAGTVRGSSCVGGVVGGNFSGTVTNTYYNNTIFTGSGIGAGSGGTTGLSTSQFGTASNFSNLGTFNTWNSSTGAFNTTSATSAPWFEGKVVSGSGTITAPMLVPDFPTATVTGNGSSVYNGSTVTAGYTTTYTMGASAIPTGITVSTSIGPNAGSYTVMPTVSGTISAPTTQTSVDSVSAVSGTWTITPLHVMATLTFTGSVTNPTKVYDGTTTATLTPTNSSAILCGFVKGQGATYTGATGSYSTANAGNGISVSATLGTNDFTTFGSGFSWSNYSLPTMTLSGTGTITKAPLTFTGSVSNPTKVYDGTTTATLTTSNSSAALSRFVNGQGATYTGATGSYSTANAGKEIPVSATLGTGDFTTSGSGFSWSNYSLPTMTLSGTGTINQLSVTATANFATMTYGGTVPTLSGTFSTTGPTGGLANLSASWTTPATSSSNVGSYAVNPGTYSYANGAVSGDFSITNAAGNATALTINPATLTFTGSVTNPTKVYDGTTAATLTTSNSSAALSGFVNGQGATYTGATGSYSTANAGTGISVSATLGTGDFTTSSSGFSWSNYSLPTMMLAGTGTIMPLPVTATANSATMTYGGTVPTLSGTVTGFVNGQTLAGDGGNATWSTSATSTSSAGQYGITGNVTLGSPYAGDYTITQASDNATALTIGKADLTATANSATMTYGGTVPSLSGTVTGFVNGQTLAGDGGIATWSTSATSSSNAGQYGITGNVTLSSPYSGDYTIIQAPGNSTALTIMSATSRTGGSSSGSGNQGGITSTNFTPVVQTVSLSGNSGSAMLLSSGQLTIGSTGSSSSGSNSTDNGISSTGNGGSSASENGSPTSQSGGSSSSGTSLTISSSGVATLTVILPANEDATGTGIISYEEVKK